MAAGPTVVGSLAPCSDYFATVPVAESSLWQPHKANPDYFLVGILRGQLAPLIIAFNFLFRLRQRIKT